MMTLREVLLKQFEYCKAIADDIIKHNASEEIIRHAKEWAEIESPMSGETDAAWVRINWEDIYIFLYFDEDKYYNNEEINFNGEICYQLDGRGEYGGEVIDVYSVEEFMSKFDSLTDEELVEQHYIFNEDGDYSDDAPKPYGIYKGK